MESVKSNQKPWWKKLSKVECKLLFVLGFAVLIILILMVVLLLLHTRKPETCLSPSCIHASDQLLSLIDSDIEPCNDFYQFVCGKFLNDLNKEDSDTDVTRPGFVNIEDELYSMIEEPIKHDDSIPLKIAKRLYSSCMDEAAFEAKGLRTIKEALRSIGGWPILEGNNWRENDYDWKMATYKLKNLGFDFETLFKVEVIIDELNNDKHILQLSPPLVPNVTEKYEKTYLNYMTEVAVLFGAERNRARNGFTELLDFEKKLFRATLLAENENKTYNPFTISELHYEFPDIPWFEYLRQILHPASKITHDDVLTITSPLYFKKLQELLRSSSRRVLANYIAWFTIHDTTNLLTKEVRALWNRYMDMTAESDDNNQKSRKENCQHICISTMNAGLVGEFAKLAYDKDSRAHVADMIGNIKDTFKAVLEDLEWIDDKTRDTAIEKVAGSVYQFELLEVVPDSNELDEMYSEIHIRDDDFLTSVLNVDVFNYNLVFQKLHEPVNSKDWKQVMTRTSGQLYITDEDVIKLDANYMHGLYFNRERPNYLNYGSLGFLIGHQLFHIFIGAKQKYNDQKSYNEWLTTQSLVNYQSNADCIVNQYGHFFIPELRANINSSLTKDEDTADLAGLKLSYQAYNAWIDNNDDEEHLPGLDYTPNQLFWISFGVTQCSKYSPDVLEQLLLSTGRSPSRFRVLGTLQNMEQFSNDFNCPNGSKMNPDDKCEIW